MPKMSFPHGTRREYLCLYICVCMCMREPCAHAYVEIHHFIIDGPALPRDFDFMYHQKFPPKSRKLTQDCQILNFVIT